jgi:hypothetical protein
MAGPQVTVNRAVKVIVGETGPAMPTGELLGRE